MIEQLAMSFERPKVEDPGIADLVDFLRGKDWMSAAQIATETKWNDRRVRELASDSDDVISYPGSPGYKLLAACTVAEYDRYRLARRAQARAMISKVIRTDRIFFRRPSVSA